MRLKRRDFINLSALAAGTSIITGFKSTTPGEKNGRALFSDVREYLLLSQFDNLFFYKNQQLYFAGKHLTR